MKDGDIRTISIIGTAVMTAIVAVPVIVFAGVESDHDKAFKAPLENMMVIEATLAYKSPKAPKQPQKVKQEAPPEVKPEGVTRDEKQKPPPDEKKKPPEDKKPPPPDKPINFGSNARPDPDAETAKDAQNNAPAFDGSKFGTDRTTTGHPFWQKLRADLAWEYPQILEATQPAVGCIHLDADGKIAETTIHTKSSDDSLNDAAEHSLKKLQKLRNDNPIPVPVELLKSATAEWACFKFDASKSE